MIDSETVKKAHTEMIEVVNKYAKCQFDRDFLITTFSKIVDRYDLCIMLEDLYYMKRKEPGEIIAMFIGKPEKPGDQKKEDTTAGAP